ncbi:MAG: PaaI family thioesterase [bacterium]
MKTKTSRDSRRQGAGPDRMQALQDVLNASPVYAHLRMRVLAVSPGSSRVELAAAEEVRNLHGKVHGGILATLVDSACGIALGTLLEAGESLVTLDLRVNYIAPAEDGTLIADGKVVHLGRQTGVAEATVTGPGNRLLAKGMATHFVQQKKTPPSRQEPGTGAASSAPTTPGRSAGDAPRERRGRACGGRPEARQAGATREHPARDEGRKSRPARRAVVSTLGRRTAGAF